MKLWFTITVLAGLWLAASGCGDQTGMAPAQPEKAASGADAGPAEGPGGHGLPPQASSGGLSPDAPASAPSPSPSPSPTPAQPAIPAPGWPGSGTDATGAPPASVPVEPSPAPSPAPAPAPAEPGPGAGADPVSGSGTCLKGGGDYSQKGPYSHKTSRSGSYTFYLPEGMNGCKAPVIAFAMGTGAPSLSYTHWYQHFASYGFAVVVDPNTMALSGASLKKGIDAIYSAHAGLLSDKAGTTGHSQGGAGAFNARSHAKVKTIVAIQPGQFPSAGDNNVNYLGLAGTADMFGMGTDPKLFHYPQVTGPKFYAKLSGADHIGAPINGASPHAVAYRAISTGWFRCFLADDSNACGLFDPGDCSSFPGKWAACESKNLP